jgi:hypothetical protein
MWGGVRFGTLTCTPHLSGARPVPHAINFGIRSTFGQVLGYLENEGGDLCCTINVHIKEEQVPRCVSVPGISADVPSRILMAQATITVDVTVVEVNDVCLFGDPSSSIHGWNNTMDC